MRKQIRVSATNTPAALRLNIAVCGAQHQNAAGRAPRRRRLREACKLPVLLAGRCAVLLAISAQPVPNC